MKAESLAQICMWGNQGQGKRANNGAHLLMGLISYIQEKQPCDISDADYILAILDIADDIFLKIADETIEQEKNLKLLEKAVNNGAESENI